MPPGQTPLDRAPAPCAAACDPASSSGNLFTRTEIDASIPDTGSRLHATGIHP